MARRTHHDPTAPAAFALTQAVLGGLAPLLRPEPTDAKVQHLLLRRPVDLELDRNSFRALWPEDFGPQFYFAKLAPHFFARLFHDALRGEAGKFRLPSARQLPESRFNLAWTRPVFDVWLLTSERLIECRLRVPSEAVDPPPQFRQPREGDRAPQLTAVASPCPQCGRTARHRQLRVSAGFAVCPACGRSFRA